MSQKVQKLKKLNPNQSDYKCTDGSSAMLVDFEFKLPGVQIPLVRGKVNAPGAGAIWHEAHWDHFGRYIGSDNQPLDEFHLNLVI